MKKCYFCSTQHELKEFGTNGKIFVICKDCAVDIIKNLFKPETKGCGDNCKCKEKTTIIPNPIENQFVIVQPENFGQRIPDLSQIVGVSEKNGKYLARISLPKTEQIRQKKKEISKTFINAMDAIFWRLDKEYHFYGTGKINTEKIFDLFYWF